MQTKNEFLLGIDPGSYKTGVAKVKPDGEVISAEWVETQTLTEVLTKLNTECGAAIKAVIIGNGTNTKPVHKVLGQVFTGVPVIEIRNRRVLCTGSLTSRTAGARFCQKACVYRRNRWMATQRQCW